MIQTIVILVVITIIIYQQYIIGQMTSAINSQNFVIQMHSRWMTQLQLVLEDMIGEELPDVES